VRAGGIVSRHYRCLNYAIPTPGGYQEPPENLGDTAKYGSVLIIFYGGTPYRKTLQWIVIILIGVCFTAEHRCPHDLGHAYKGEDLL
jgi:hypothetical protein